MMDWKRQCAAVIPCFNEAAHIGAVIAGVRRHLPTVIVMDDGSTDGTGRRAEEWGAEVIRRPVNGGKGCALSAGWEHGRGLGFEWALDMDGDGQHSAEDVPKFLECAERTGAALVVGNRLGNPGAMPWLRRRVNRWMSRRLSRLTGVWLPDTQCGFRLARLDALLPLKGRAQRFEIESEMLTTVLAAGHQVEFVPVQVIYNNSASRIDPLLDTWRWLRWAAAA